MCLRVCSNREYALTDRLAILGAVGKDGAD